jgi:serine/threonine protein kinase
VAQDANSVGPKAGAGEAHRVGMFEILNEIGRGGMGIVYRARDLRLQRLVALKRPHAELLERPGFHVKFIEEAQTASKIMHPNITTVFEVFEDEEVPWMVMELIDGASLRSLLDGQAPLPIEITLKHAEGLIDALRVAHLYGVLHRDIKPNNILVGGDGRARLSDFGLARARAEIPPTEQFSQATTETKTDGHVVGTRGYMSPEQALGKSLDCRTDIFSLGVVLYEMCTGHRAFPRSDSGEFLDALLHREPLPIPQLNSEIPIEFEEIVRKALAKRRFQRYQSANEMLLDVRALRRRLQSDPNYSASKAGRRWPRWPARRVSAVVVTSFLVMSVAGIVAFQRWRGIRSDETIPPLRPKRITSFPGAKIDPAISPDGNEVAFSLERGVTSDIWLTDVRGGKPLQLTENEAVDINPAWFPDGASIAFTRVTGDRSSVYRSPRLGGGAILMLPNAGHPSISPDGRMIAFSRADPGGFWRIWVAPIDALDRARQVTGKDSGLWDHLNPSWSPDGSTLCYEDFRDLSSARAIRTAAGLPTVDTSIFRPFERVLRPSGAWPSAEARWRGSP